MDDAAATATADWNELASRVLSGHALTRDESLAVLQSPDESLLELLAASYRVRRQHFGNQVQLYYLKNAKSGLCPEDCGYCSQSVISDAPIERYSIANERTLLEGARKAKESNAARTASSPVDAARAIAR